MWRHTKRGDRYVTVVIDLTPGTRPQWSGPAAGRGSGPVQEGHTRPGSPSATRTGVGGSRWWRWAASPGPESAAGEELPQTWAVMGPYARRVPSRRQARPVPPPRPAGDHGPAGPGR